MFCIIYLCFNKTNKQNAKSDWISFLKRRWTDSVTAGLNWGVSLSFPVLELTVSLLWFCIQRTDTVLEWDRLIPQERKECVVPGNYQKPPSASKWPTCLQDQSSYQLHSACVSLRDQRQRYICSILIDFWINRRAVAVATGTGTTTTTTGSQPASPQAKNSVPFQTGRFQKGTLN